MGWFSSNEPEEPECKHQYKVVLTAYAAPMSPAQMTAILNEGDTDYAFSERETLGCTTVLQQCALCTETYEHQILGKAEGG